MQTLRNKKGEVIGSLQTQGKYTYLYDRKGKRLGFYDEKLDNTYDARGKLIGAKSNILVTLLHP